MPSRYERLVRMALSLWVVAIIGWCAAIALVVNALDQTGFYVDFLAFWAAGKLAVAGEGLAVWDVARFNEAQGIDPNAEQVLSWFYPATFHLLVVPFGLLPFSLAFALWTAITIGAFWRAISLVSPAAILLIIMSPAIFLTVKLGNNAPLFAACLAFALCRLDRPAKAGSAIAVMTLKPGLGPMIAVAMVAGSRWRVVGWVSVVAIALIVAATGVFGIAYWSAFLDNLSFAIARITPDARLTEQMTSWYALFRYLGLGSSAAMSLHLTFLAMIAGATVLMWLRQTTDPNLRAAALALSVILSSPHAFHYEMVYALVAIGFLFRAGLGSLEKMIVLFLWVGPLPGIWPIDLVPVCLFGAPILTLCFTLITWRALRPRGHRAEPLREAQP